MVAPIEKGERVGEVVFSVGGAEVGRREIVALDGVERLDLGKMILVLLRKCASVM